VAFFYEAKPLSENCFSWSITASSNDVADPAVPWPEGMLPGAVNNAARALMAGVARYIADTNGTITTGGTAGSYSVTSNSGHTALTNGILIAVKASATNTAGATLNLNTIGAKSIRTLDTGAEAAVTAGQIVSGGTYQFRYDTAANSSAGGWILLNPTVDPATKLTAGSIKIWPSDTLETGWLWANGASLLRTDYPALFLAIGTVHGAADGTHFNVPDICGRAPFGSDDMGGIAAKSRITNAESSIVGTTLGASGGVESVILATPQLAAHSHAGTTNSGGVDHVHTGTTNVQSANHTHAQATPTTTNGQFSGPGAIGWGGTYPNNSTQTGNESATHTHDFTTSGATSFNHTHTFTTGSSGTNASHTNMPPALITNYVIKT
jgi:microcystin-dependent protein